MEIKNIEEKIGNDKEDIENTKDDNRATFINEPLWKKVIFKVLGYLAYIVGLVLANPTNWLQILSIGFSMTILPIIWSALDAQSRNKEIQERIENEEKLESEKTVWTIREKVLTDEVSQLKTMVGDKKIEIIQIKSDLDLACSTLAANKIAFEKAITLNNN